MTDDAEALELLKLRLGNAVAMMPDGHPARSAFAGTAAALESVLGLALVLRTTAIELEQATGQSQAGRLNIATVAITSVRDSVSRIEAESGETAILIGTPFDRRDAEA